MFNRKQLVAKIENACFTHQQARRHAAVKSTFTSVAHEAIVELRLTEAAIESAIDDAVTQLTLDRFNVIGVEAEGLVNEAIFAILGHDPIPWQPEVHVRANRKMAGELSKIVAAVQSARTVRPIQ